SVLTLCLPPWFTLIIVAVQFVLACFLRFTFREQFCDVRPVFYYAVLLYFVKILGIAVEMFSLDFAEVFSKNVQFTNDSRLQDFFSNAKAFCSWFISHFTWKREKETLVMLLKIFCLMQTASLMFKTSTSLQIREGFETMEHFVRKIFTPKKRTLHPQVQAQNQAQILVQTPIATALSMFVNFIPMVAQIWAQSKRAWKARGGKNGIKMYAALFHVLFSVGMKKAWNTARAVQVRMEK
nr:hypothetical protein [Treponema sp.]